MTEHPSHAAPELLAPAGSRDALVAAVANGADAVYLGLKDLNARRGAENFAPRRARRGHALRAPARPARLPHGEHPRAGRRDGRALETVDEAWAAGVDAVIVQDLGLLALHPVASCPQVRVHASTQMNAHNAASVRDAARSSASRA